MARTDYTGRRIWLVWGELAGLWTLVFAQRAFDRIASGPDAFTQIGADRLDLILIIIVVALLPPTVAWLVEIAVARLRSPAAAHRLHAVIFGAAIGLVFWQFAVAQGLAVPLRFLPAIALGAGGTWLYLNARVIRQFTELLALATPVVIAIFAFTYPASAQMLPSKSPSEVAPITARTPVVLVVFDEFPLDMLLDRKGRVDHRLFPNFARLARSSTWYPNARAVTASTIRAVPAIMSGRLPSSRSRPLVSDHALPDNLCDLLDRGGYRVNAVETITEFCGARHSRPDRLRTMLSRTLASGVVPPSGLLPEISDSLVAPPPGPIPSFSGGRAEEFNRFIDSIGTDRRSFNFAHPMLPHRRWMYMPDGRRFTPDPRPWGLRRPERDFLFQQAMLQVGFVDREIGRLVTRMKARGIWRDSLLVVTADHGLNMTFRGQADDLPETGQPTWDSRDLTAENAGALLPIPLFVKFPGQNGGRTERVEVTSADIAPTVFRELGMNPPAEDPLDGRPLQEERPARIDPIRALSRTGNLNVPRETYRDARREARLLRQRLFASGSFYATGGHPGLIGSAVADRPGLVPLHVLADRGPAGPDGGPKVGPGRWLFRLGERLTGPGRAVAIAVNGKVVATVRPWYDRRTGEWTAGIILPDSAFRALGNQVTVHAIPPTR